MRVYKSEPCTFHQNDFLFLTVLAQLAVPALENTVLYEYLKGSYEGVMQVLGGSLEYFGPGTMLHLTRVFVKYGDVNFVRSPACLP
jgi:hypothetical protein